MTTPSPIRTVIIDGHALCYRAFFAVQSLKNSKGQPTNAVFGFLNILRKIRKDLAPTHMAVCFDVSKKTNRHEKYAQYKIQRPSMPEDLSAQIPVIKELVRAYNIPIFEKEGIEADDVIATLAVRLKGPGREVVIASDDKDMYQLVGEGVAVYSSRREAILGPAETRERFGVGPEKIVDYLALTGDTSDNIPGVDGIGEVTAKSLMTQFDSLDEIFKNVDQLKGKLKEKLEKGRESALLSRELATLDTNIELECGLETIKVKAPDTAKLAELFRELEFRSFTDELTPGGVEGRAQSVKARKAAKSSPEETEANVPPVAPAAPAVKIDAGEISDDIRGLIKEAHASGQIAIVPCFGTADLFASASFYVFGGSKVYRFAVEELVSLKDVLVSDKVCKVVYDAKAFLKFLRRVDLDINGEVFDALLAGYLLRSGRSAFSLEALAWAYLNTPVTEASREAQEATLLARLREPLEKALHEENLFELYSKIELPLSAVLADMELAGVRIDDKLLAGLSLKAEQTIAQMTGKLHELAGGEFNLNSPKQLAHILFDTLKLPVARRTKTGFSTDEEVLTKLSSKHELPRLILEYRGIAKLKSTYIDALPRMIDPTSGRVHCSFDQTGAETGRLSSNHPNLQNIPVRTELGREIRKAFIPSEKGHLLLSVDYSQIELRVLAHIADEPNLKRAFEAGEDIHRYTASLMFDVPQDKVTTEMRYNAKRINFGIVYGMSAFGLAKDLAVPQKEAQAFIDTYFARYPGIRDFMDREIAKAREQGFVETMFGRRRYLPEITSRNPAVRQFAERQAINTPVQGAAADLIKAAMVQLSAKLAEQDSPAKMIITVHDELVLDAPQDAVKDTAKLVKQVMETAVVLSVPLEVTVKAGLNWVEMEKV